MVVVVYTVKVVGLVLLANSNLSPPSSLSTRYYCYINIQCSYVCYPTSIYIYIFMYNIHYIPLNPTPVFYNIHLIPPNHTVRAPCMCVHVHVYSPLSPTYDVTRPLIGQLPGCTILYARVNLVYPGKPLTTQWRHKGIPKCETNNAHSLFSPNKSPEESYLIIIR